MKMKGEAKGLRNHRHFLASEVRNGTYGSYGSEMSEIEIMHRAAQV